MSVTEPLANLGKLAEWANIAHRRAETAAKNALSYARTAGEHLNQAKENCPHGTWLNWLERNFEGSQRTAYNYMSIHTHWPELEGGKSIRHALELLKDDDEPEDEPNLQRVATLPADAEPEVIPPDPAMEGINPKDQRIIIQLVNELTDGHANESAVRSLAAVAQEVIASGAIDDGSGEQVPWMELSPERKRALLMSNLEQHTYERMQQHKNRKRSISDATEKTTLPTGQVGELRKLAGYAPHDLKSKYEQKWRDRL